MQRFGRLAGARALLARRVADLLARLVGLLEVPRPEPGLPEAGDPLEAASEICYLVEEVRRGSLSPSRLVSLVSWWAASRAPESVALEVVRRGLEARPRRVGLLGLAEGLIAYARRPSRETLGGLVSGLAGELTAPCQLDVALEDERRKAEANMKRVGLLLALTLPALFIASLLYNPLIGLLSIAAALILWVVIRREGLRFRLLNVEGAWRRCALNRDEIRVAIEGRDLPSPLELLGLGNPLER